MHVLLARLGYWLIERHAAGVPKIWVGVTRYEGADDRAAEAAFRELQAESERVTGTIEWMHGGAQVRSFKVV
jgi:hypothetical protein